MKVLIADGGTGGHIFPAIAVADELRTRNEVTGVLFTGTPLGLEEEIVPKHGYELRMIEVGGLIGKSALTKIKTMAQLPGAYRKSRQIVRDFSPSVAIGFGAYASGPVLVAVHRAKIPFLLVEPNAIPGFTNRLLLRYAKAVAVAFADEQGFYRGKSVVTGNPVRPLQRRAVKKDKFTVGVFGGSQGARAINDTVVKALPALAGMRSQLHIIHQTGKLDYQRIRILYESTAPFFEVAAFIDDVEEFYNRCDVLVCRSGAITLAEITCVGKPAILIPLPTSTHNHQEVNARRLEAAGAARVYRQCDFTADVLVNECRKLLHEPQMLASMANASQSLGKPEATKNVVDLALSLSA